MTDAEKNRAVAEACGYDAVPSSTKDNIWHVWDNDVWQGAVGNKVYRDWI